MPSWIINLAIVISVTALMELVATVSHKYIMHGWGWGWHESHHTNHDEMFEKNDWYAFVFAIPSSALCFIGYWYDNFLVYVGIGMTVYGFLYFIVHDGLVHNRWPWRVMPRGKYMTRLVQAHRMHHAVHGKDGCVSFGFLIASDVRTLKEKLRSIHGGNVANHAERKAHTENQAGGGRSAG